MQGQDGDKPVVKGEVVHLDYKDLENVRYEQCKMVYEGGRPPSMTGVDIVDCEFVFEGKADNTLHMLRLIAHGGDAGLVVNQMLGLKSWAPNDG